MRTQVDAYQTVLNMLEDITYEDLAEKAAVFAVANPAFAAMGIDPVTQNSMWAWRNKQIRRMRTKLKKLQRDVL